jgi:VIT1/CCC1 family predicted Fe2+/Mn2+ transporter
MPWKAALSTFGAFLVCGSVPLLPFVVDATDASGLSLAPTALVFFGIGTAKSRWSVTSWWRSGLETLAVGLAAAGLAFAIGYWLKGFV